MKKKINYLLWLLIFTIIINFIFKIISCNNNDNRYDFNNFLKNIKNKENFILELSTYECNYCQAFEKGTLKELYKKNKNNIFLPNEKFKDYLDGKIIGQSIDSSIDGSILNSKLKINNNERNKLKNTKLINTFNYFKNNKDIFNEKWIKKILNWIVNEERKINKTDNGEINYLIDIKKLKLEQVPIFIYIKDGEYRGIEYGTLDNFGKIPNLEYYIKKFIEHMIIGVWNNNNIY